MAPNKSQLDTIELFLSKMVSTEKAALLRTKFEKKDEELADKAIKLFETRRTLRIQDIEKLLE